MAIKAIINNTEKEIEQIKNSDEQDIDYVYSRIGDTEAEGELPISIKSIGGNLAGYRIYGNTVGGESVGDLVESGEHAGEYKVAVTVEGKNLWSGVVEQGYVSIAGLYGSSTNRIRSKNVPLEPGTYTISTNLLIRTIYAYNDDNPIDLCLNATNGAYSPSFTVPAGANNVSIAMMKVVDDVQVDITPSDFIWGQIEEGSEATTYEPYHAPVTTPIYLPEQIKKVGDEAEYIDYGEQKMHRIGADDIDVTLPALSTIKGTNTLSVNTAIQPSNIYIKDNFDYKKVFTATRAIEDELPLNYRSIEDNDSALSNYLIYGNTVDGESVGDRTGNLCNIIVPNGIVKDELYLTVNDDKSITLNGYANSTAVIHISDFISAGNYYIAGCPDEGGSSSFRIVARDRNNSNIATESGDGVQINATSDFDICIRIAEYYNCDGLTFFPIVSLSESSYEPYGYKVPVTVEGKNLLQNTTISRTTSSGLTITVNDNKSVVVDGTSSTGNAVGIVLGGNVNLNKGAYILSGCPQGGSNNTYKLYCIFDDDGERKVLADTGDGATIVLNGDNPKVIKDGFYIYVLSCNNNVFYPMLRRADIEDDTYEPYHAPVTTPIYLTEPIKTIGDEAEYIDYGKQKQHRVRKNLLRNTGTSKTVNGVTFTVNADGSVTCNGTATKNAFFNVNSDADTSAYFNFIENHILTGCPMGGSLDAYYIRFLSDGVASNAEYGSGVAINGRDSRTSLKIQIAVASGYTCDNLTFYPMIRKADIEDDTYEPYIENTDLDVTLPALPVLPGTNTMSIETEIEPSNIYIKGKIKSLN